MASFDRTLNPKVASAIPARPISETPPRRPRSAVCRQRLRELGTRTDVELAVGVRKVGLDGLDGQEQRLRYLAVAATVRGHAGDAPLGRGERVRAGGAQRAHLL